MMEWNQLKGIIGKAAPILGTLVGGPAGAAVGGLIAAGLGVDSTPDAVGDALLKNPDAYVKLQEIEANSKVQLQQLTVTAEQNRLAAGTAQYAAEAQDRDSARKLAAQQPNDWMRPMLAIGVLLLTAYIVYQIMSGGAESIIKDTTAALTVGTLIGYVISELKQVYGFYFGMTKDAAVQSQAIADFAVSPGSVTTPDSTPVQQKSTGVDMLRH
jgi:hypothetical protein